MPSDRIEIIYNPVRQTENGSIESGDEDLVQWWNLGAIKLIAVGSLKAQKDYPTLLKAMDLLCRTADARLIILGEGPERPKLEQFVKNHGLSDSVRLPGFRISPHPYLRQADIFVLSSRWEGLGNVITEALLCGCRVVSTDCPSGPDELLANGRYGTLVPPRDPERLAQVIAERAAMPHDPEPGRRWARRFNPDAAAEAYLNLLFPDGET
jgi:glycosyltransferase involved in cell wall biosynthesis